MADILLFGATGFTGRLTAKALARRGASFAICGRNRAKLESLAQKTGSPDVHIAQAGDTAALVRALEGVRVLVTSVGPFSELGYTAANAAIEAGVHYIDSTGEVLFVDRLLREFDARARAAGVAMAPAIGFDEVPADVGITLACEGMSRPSAKVTYATPTTASRGTLQSVLELLASQGFRVSAGKLRSLTSGDCERWAPMPPPLGVRRSISAPMAIGRIAPLHIDLESLDSYMTIGTFRHAAFKVGFPLVRGGLAIRPVRDLVWKAIRRLPEGPVGDARRARWTVLVEARSNERFRNVVVVGRDVYGLTAELLASSAIVMSDDEYVASGVLAPVDAIGLETLHKELVDNGVNIDSFEPV
jgi:short subunit dehydrogenase-like uncharacterized protein